LAKGQLFTTDYIIGVAVFLLVFGICLFTWQKVAYTMENDYFTYELKYTARRASEQLVRSPGAPANWEEDVSSLRALGLAEDYGVISRDKVDELANIEYDTLREHLGMGGKEFYMRIHTPEGQIIKEVGEAPGGNTVVNVRRIGLMDNATVLVDLMVWVPEWQTPRPLPAHQMERI
jgi:hypothetical protein